MLETLKHIDVSLFHLVNSDMQNGLFDLICPFARKQSNWYLVYAWIGYFMYKKYKLNSLWIFLTAGLLVLISDQISANLIKNTVQRLRPCNDPALKEQVRLLVHCGSGYSFISAHATNHFAIAVLLASLYREWKWAYPVALFWAAFISFSQVYVGVHFPADILFGSILGTILGAFAFHIVNKKLNPIKQVE